MKAISGIKKITKTMEMVSVAKMKRASDRAGGGRAYDSLAQEFLTHIPNKFIESHRLIAPRTASDKHYLVVLIGSDKGLCGGYNVQLTRTLHEFCKDKTNIHIVTLGKMGDKIARKLGLQIDASFGVLPELLNPGEVHHVISHIISRYKQDEKIVECVIVSQKLISGITLSSDTTQLLPLPYKKHEHDDPVDMNFIIEPSPQVLLDTVLPGLVESFLIQKVLEARAAEHTARMVAMKNATDNATSYYDQLKLTFNRVRQAAITQEIAEIVGGSSELSN